MPFTYFAHQAFVLPLKLARPRWFDGTALCIGSMAPDFAYAFEMLPFAFESHTIISQFTWTLPVGIMRASWVVAAVLALATLRARRYASAGGTLTGRTFQIRSQYSRIERSDEK